MKKFGQLLVCLSLILILALAFASCEKPAPGSTTTTTEDPNVIKANDTLEEAIEHIKPIEQEQTSMKVRITETNTYEDETITSVQEMSIIFVEDSLEASMLMEVNGEDMTVYVKDGYMYMAMEVEGMNYKMKSEFDESMLNDLMDEDDAKQGYIDNYDKDRSTISISGDVATLTLIIPADKVKEIKEDMPMEGIVYNEGKAIYKAQCSTGILTEARVEISYTDTELGMTCTEVTEISEINSVAPITFPDDLDEYELLDF